MSERHQYFGVPALELWRNRTASGAEVIALRIPTSRELSRRQREKEEAARAAQETLAANLARAMGHPAPGWSSAILDNSWLNLGTTSMYWYGHR